MCFLGAKSKKITICNGTPPLTYQPSLVQEYREITNLQTELNCPNSFKFFCIFSDLGLPGLGWMGGGVGVPSTYMHMQAHSHALMKNLHVQKLQMAAPFRHPCLSCLTCVCVCVCVCVHIHACAWGFSLPTHTPTHPPPNQ